MFLVNLSNLIFKIASRITNKFASEFVGKFARKLANKIASKIVVKFATLLLSIASVSLLANVLLILLKLD